LSPESSTSRNETSFQSSGTGKRIPDFGASTHWLPAGRVASVGGADADAVADAVADVDAEPAADAEPASVDGEPPHPDRARAATAAVAAAVVVVTKDLMALLPLVA
jgi:hypothetical protein